MKKKDNFILYHNQYPLIEELSNNDKGVLLDSLFQYSMNKKIPDFKKGSALSMVFKSIRNSIDISNEKYEERCRKNQENINSRYEADKYGDKYIYLHNEKMSYETFKKTYKNKGYTDKRGNTLQFSQIFDEQLQCCSECGDMILLKDKYNCSNIDSTEINDYYDEFLE